jgi:hypothetical protein
MEASMHTQPLPSASPCAAERPSERWGKRAEDRELARMLEAYRRSGGLVSGHDAARLLRKRADQPLSILARWIVSRAVVCFEACGETWLPMFQFDRDMSLRQDVRRATAELAGAFDAWQMALWLATPHASLDGAAPVDLIAEQPERILAAARSERFIETASVAKG